MAASPNSRQLKYAQILFYLNTLTWVGFAVITFQRMGSNPGLGIILAVLMLGNAAAMLVSGLCLGRPQKRFYALALAVVMVNIVLSITDQPGLADFLVLAADLVLFGLLVSLRGRYANISKE